MRRIKFVFIHFEVK